MFANVNKNAEAEKCLRELAAGNADALGELYALTGAFVYGYALSLLRNHSDAEDVRHACFLKLLDEPQSYEPRGKPLAWLAAVTRNLCMMKLRERRREAPLGKDEAERIELPDDGRLSPEDAVLLNECMRALTPEENGIIVMHIVGGMKHREIAAALGMKTATVISKYGRALKKLGKELENEE